MNTRVGLALSLALGAGILLHAGEARADRPWQAMTQGSRIGLETDLWPTTNFFAATMDLGAQIAVHPNIGIDIDIPWAFGTLNILGINRGEAAFGNPTLGLHVVGKVSPALALHGGFSLSIPTRLSIPPASAETALFAIIATTSRAYYDVYRDYPEFLWMRFPLGLEAHFGDYFYYRGDLNPVVAIPVGEDNKGAPATVLLEHADEIEGRAPMGLGGGFRVQFVFGLSDKGEVLAADQAQVAVEPFFVYEPPGPGFFARFGVLVALDRPLGFGFDQGKLATIRTTLGGKF